MVSIEGLDKASVLKALHDASKAPEDERQFCPMSEAMAKRFIEAGQRRFDFVNRRALKFDIGATEFDATEYDAQNGAGLAERVIAELRGPVAETQSKPAAATESQAVVAAEPEPAAATESQAVDVVTDPPVAVAETLPAPAPEKASRRSRR